MTRTILILALWSLAFVAYADEEICQSMANLTREAALQRDQGLSKEQWLQNIKPAIVEQDEAGRKYAIAVAYVVSNQVWRFPLNPPGTEANAIYSTCIKENW